MAKKFTVADELKSITHISKLYLVYFESFLPHVNLTELPKDSTVLERLFKHYNNISTVDITSIATARSRYLEAKNKFVLSNRGLVVSIASKFKTSRLPLTDMIQEGTLGLIEAVERYDPTLGYRFSTYAAFLIRQYIVGALKSGRNSSQYAKRISMARERFVNYFGRSPSVEELAKYSGVSATEILAGYGDLRFELNSDDLADVLDDGLPNAFDVMEADQVKLKIKAVTEGLSPKELCVLGLNAGVTVSVTEAKRIYAGALAKVKLALQP